MWNVAETTTPVARKDYICDACVLIKEGFTKDDFTPEEWVVIEKAIYEEEGKILKGTKYIKTKGFWEHKPATFRGRLDIDEICFQNGLYEE